MDLTPPKKVHAHPYENANYRNMLGVDPIGDLVARDPFKGKPPTDPRDYQIYRNYYEDGYYKMMKGLPLDESPINDPNAEQSVPLKVSASCEWMDDHGNPVVLHRVRKEHVGNTIMWCCNHVIFADPVNPEGVVCIPFKRDVLYCYFLCKTCFKLLQNCRLRFDEVLAPKCGNCVKESIDKLMAKHPDRFKDLRFDGTLPYRI